MESEIQHRPEKMELTWQFQASRRLCFFSEGASPWKVKMYQMTCIIISKPFCFEERHTERGKL